jgi:hypothetical protein
MHLTNSAKQKRKKRRAVDVIQVSVEFKLKDLTRDEWARLQQLCFKYTNVYKYGLAMLKPTRADEKTVYDAVTHKKDFQDIPSRTISLAVEDVMHARNSIIGLKKIEEAGTEDQSKRRPPRKTKTGPLTCRFDKYSSSFSARDDFIFWKISVEREKKGKTEKMEFKLAPERSLRYKYYQNLFSTSKGYRLPARLICRNGQFYVKVSVERKLLAADQTKLKIFVGIDLNAFWVGKAKGHDLVAALLNVDGKPALRERFVKEWSQIPAGIRERQRGGKRGQVKKFISNRIGQAIKYLMKYTKDFSVVWVLEDLTGLKDLKGPYSKFAYKKFAEILQTKVLDVMFVSPAYTSQTCWKCGGKAETNGRTMYCKQCYPKGFHRDLNAAINIAKRGIYQYLHPQKYA